MFSVLGSVVLFPQVFTGPFHPLSAHPDTNDHLALGASSHSLSLFFLVSCLPLFSGTHFPWRAPLAVSVNSDIYLLKGNHGPSWGVD